MAKAKPSFLPSRETGKTIEWLWCNSRFLEKYPALYELLAAGMYEGQPRKGATVTLFCSDGRLKACVADRETGQAIWLALEPFEDILAEIELVVAAGTTEWRGLKKGQDMKGVL